MTYLLPEELPQAKNVLAQAKEANKHDDQQDHVCDERASNAQFEATCV